MTERQKERLLNLLIDFLTIAEDGRAVEEVISQVRRTL